MNSIRFFVPHGSIAYETYSQEDCDFELIVPRIGELIWLEGEETTYIVKHIMHGYDHSGDMVDVFLDYPDEDYYDADYWINPEELARDDYMDKLVNDCACANCEEKVELPIKDIHDEFLKKVKDIFNELGYDVEIDVQVKEV